MHKHGFTLITCIIYFRHFYVVDVVDIVDVVDVVDVVLLEVVFFYKQRLPVQAADIVGESNSIVVLCIELVAFEMSPVGWSIG